MIPLILLILEVSAVSCDSHSLHYFRTAVFSPGSDLFSYFSIGYVDNQEITHYSSHNRQCLSKVDWMKKVDSGYWERNTKINQVSELVYKHRGQALMKRFNQTGGVHTIQVAYGCELKDDGTTTGYERHGYDGRDFMYLDMERGIWIPSVQEAQITTQRYNSPEVREGEIEKYYLENECIMFLKNHIKNGREELEKRVRPEVKVWGRTQSDGLTRLQCLVYGFQPRAVDVKWMKNGVDHVPSDEMSPILPHPDGTYQLRVGVEVPTTEEDTYSCHVEHSSLGKDTFSVKWEADNGPPILVITVAIGCLVAVIGGVVYFLYRKKERKCEYSRSNHSHANSDSSNIPEE